jgi:hypothetical protein
MTSKEATLAFGATALMRKPNLVVLAVLSVAGLLVIWNWHLSSQIKDVHSAVKALDRNTRAAEATEQFFLTDGVFNTRTLFCSKGEGVVCQLTRLQLYPDLGRHPPLWVLLDALLETGKKNLSLEQRGQFNKILANVYSSSNKSGAIELAERQGAVEWADANTMYRGLLAQAAVCRQAPDLCEGELPPETVATIRRIVQFLQQTGVVVAPYEMHVRAEAIKFAAEHLSP